MPPRPLLVLSPHLDDAVLSLRGAIGANPGSVVATVFSGGPDDESLTGWDSDAGFETSRACVANRMREDREALEVLGAAQRALGFLGGQYSRPPAPGAVWSAIVDLLEATAGSHRPCGPLGLGHGDHEDVADAFVAAAVTAGLERIWIYEEVPYRVEIPEVVEERLGVLRRDGWNATQEFLGSCDDARCEAALWCYESQVALIEDHDLWALETVWRLERR